MNDSTLAFLGIAGGVVNTIGLFPYIRDIFKHKTKPERATWWIWVAINSIAILALIDAGPTWGLMALGMQTGAMALIAGLSIKYGYGTFHKRDAISLIVAIVGIVLWRVTQQPLLALIILIGVDMTALWLTITKTWKAPHTETLSAWILAQIACFLGLLAVGSWDFTKLVFQTYIFVGSSLLVGIILYRRPKVTKDEEAKLEAKE